MNVLWKSVFLINFSSQYILRCKYLVTKTSTTNNKNLRANKKKIEVNADKKDEEIQREQEQ